MANTVQNNLRRGRRCVFVMHVHLVFITKYRKKVFEANHVKSMREIMERVCEDFEAELKAFNGEGDVHLLVNYPPKVAVSKLVNSLKGVSSRMLKKVYPELGKPYWKGVLWSSSYFSGSCGGAPLSIIRKYIEQPSSPS